MLGLGWVTSKKRKIIRMWSLSTEEMKAETRHWLKCAEIEKFQWKRPVWLQMITFPIQQEFLHSSPYECWRYFLMNHCGAVGIWNVRRPKPFSSSPSSSVFLAQLPWRVKALLAGRINPTALQTKPEAFTVNQNTQNGIWRACEISPQAHTNRMTGRLWLEKLEGSKARHGQTNLQKKKKTF